MKDYMKKSNNIYLLPTDQPTGIFETNSGLQFSIMNKVRHGEFKGFHIYITSDEEIKKDEYYLGDDNHIYNLVTSVNNNGKKIVLTTDPTLIADGVQSIDDEFLEWFVKNSSCEFVEVNKKLVEFPLTFKMMYKIIIPQDEPKQVKYTEDEVRELLIKGLTHNDDKLCGSLVTVQKEIRTANFNVWFEENKKK